MGFRLWLDSAQTAQWMQISCLLSSFNCAPFAQNNHKSNLKKWLCDVCLGVSPQLSCAESPRLWATAASMLTGTLSAARWATTVATVTTPTLTFQWQPCVWRMAAGVMRQHLPGVSVSIFWKLKVSSYLLFCAHGGTHDEFWFYWYLFSSIWPNGKHAV